MAPNVASVATDVASVATIGATRALKIIVAGFAGGVIRKAATTAMTRPSRVPHNLRVSNQYLDALALGIYKLSVANQKIFTASALFSYVSENCLKELDALNTKDLLLFADKNSIKGDIKVSYLLDKRVNDVLIEARYRLSARAGRVVTQLELHRLAISIVAER